MHLPLLPLLSLLTLLTLHPILPPTHALPSPHPLPLLKRAVACSPTPSPNLQPNDCVQALSTLLQPPGPNQLPVLVHLTTSGAASSLAHMPLAAVVGTCRVSLQLVNGALVGPLPVNEVVHRAANLITLCVDRPDPRGGVSVFAYVRIMVEEVGPGERAAGRAGVV